MGTEVLRPQNFLAERVGAPPAQFSRSATSFGNDIYNSYHCRSNRKPIVRSDRPEQRKRYVWNYSEPSISKRLSSDVRKMAKATILRRGESLDSKIKTNTLTQEGDDLALSGTERLGPDPEMVPKQIRMVDMRSPIAVNCDVYAGSAFSMSPPPSSLPLPSFKKNKQVFKVVDDSATKDLRRLLRLDE